MYQGYHVGYVSMGDPVTPQSDISTTTSETMYFTVVNSFNAGNYTPFTGIDVATSSVGLLQFFNLFDVLKRKVPFGYFYIAKDTFSAFSANATNTLEFEIPLSFKIYIFDPLRAIMVIIMSVAGLVWLYNRVKKIHIA
jgi:hypothetical protein